MQAAVLRSLEFDRVREALASRTRTPLGRHRARALAPEVAPDRVRARLALASDAHAFVHNGGSLAVWAPDDLLTTLAGLDIADHVLEPLALLGLGRCLASIEDVAAGARRAGGPRLAAVAEQAVSFGEETAAVVRAIEPTGDVSDRASPALRDIRERLRRQRARLRSTLESLSRDRDAARYLQDQIVTDRNGRFVLVVRAEHRGAIPGIVHGSSTSGASLYLEPLATVDLNNDVVALAERERAEVQRILQALTQAFRARPDDMEATLSVAAELDLLHATADLTHRMDGLVPEIREGGSLEFVGARHPLLIPAIRDLTGESDETDHDGRPAPGPANPVGSTLRLVPPAAALVISGPNTGGKTVALKAFGLIALMAQAGLPVPVEPGSHFTPFRSVFADIGDEQSIAASLSTFSAHVSKLVAIDRTLELPALVLLDEVGGGTDPAEGGALGAAVVEHFRRRGALVVATTHDDLLKSYAATTDGVVVAGFGFDPDTYAPTYRLQYGTPGRSLAFEIAERLGLPEAVIADARARRSGRESLLAAHLARLDAEFAALGTERRAAAEARAEVEADERRLREREIRLAEREAVLKQRFDDRLGEKLREARSEIERVVEGLKARVAELEAEAGARASNRVPILTTGEVGDLRRAARAALATVGTGLPDTGPAAEPEALVERPVVGQTVLVVPFAAQGIVRSVAGSHVEVEIRGKRLRTSVADLRRPAGPPPDGRFRPRGSAPSGVTVEASAREAEGALDLVVVGCTVDEAVARTEKFLDDALLADARRLRVVHGHGTGRLRAALTEFLQVHPLVASIAAAPEREGGRGATIVELKA